MSGPGVGCVEKVNGFQFLTTSIHMYLFISLSECNYSLHLLNELLLALTVFPDTASHSLRSLIRLGVVAGKEPASLGLVCGRVTILRPGLYRAQ